MTPKKISPYEHGSPKNLSFRIENQVVRLTINAPLVAYLKRGGCSSLVLARQLKRRYETAFQKELHISTHSLALEILIHVVAWGFCHRWDILLTSLGFGENNKLRKLFQYVIYHVGVIDCGEKSIDTNRFVFDWCAVIHPLAYPIFSLMLHLFCSEKEL